MTTTARRIEQKHVFSCAQQLFEVTLSVPVYNPVTGCMYYMYYCKVATANIFLYVSCVGGSVSICSTQVTLFVAFVCFAVASRPKYIAATIMEFLITCLLLVLYTLKLNKKLTFFFWPLIDVFNSIFAAAFLLVLSLIAVSTYTVKGTLGGGIVCFMSVGLLCADSFILFKKITFNVPGESPVVS